MFIRSTIGCSQTSLTKVAFINLTNFFVIPLVMKKLRFQVQS